MSETFLLQDLQLGASSHLCEMVAATIAVMGRRPSFPSEMDFDGAAEVLAIATLPLNRGASRGAPRLPLVSTVYQDDVQAGTVVEIPPAEALKNDLIGPWLAATWTDFIALQLQAGAKWTCLEGVPPQTFHAEVRDQDGDIAVRVTMRWAGFTLYANYGCAPKYGMVTCSTQIPGANLWSLGGYLGAILHIQDVLGISLASRDLRGIEAIGNGPAPHTVH